MNFGLHYLGKLATQANLLVIHCQWIINIHIFDNPDSPLSGPFSPVPMSLDIRGVTVHVTALKVRIVKVPMKRNFLLSYLKELSK